MKLETKLRLKTALMVCVMLMGTALAHWKLHESDEILNGMLARPVPTVNLDAMSKEQIAKAFEADRQARNAKSAEIRGINGDVVTTLWTATALAAVLGGLVAGLLAWKLSQAKCRATDLLLGFSGGVFTGTLVLAVLAPVVALYYESSVWAGPVLAQIAIGLSLVAGAVLFSRSVLSRVESGRRTVVLPIAVFNVIQIATLLQLIALVSPILPEHTHVDRGIDGIARSLEQEKE